MYGENPAYYSSITTILLLDHRPAFNYHQQRYAPSTPSIDFESLLVVSACRKAKALFPRGGHEGAYPSYPLQSSWQSQIPSPCPSEARPRSCNASCDLANPSPAIPSSSNSQLCTSHKASGHHISRRKAYNYRHGT
jgi:hypothetical protein